MSIIGEASQTGLITNVSRMGARIQCDEKLGEAHIHVGLSFSFLAQPGDHDVRIETKCTILSITASNANSAHKVYVQTRRVIRRPRSHAANHAAEPCQ